MKKQHHTSLKFHTIYNLIISTILIVVIIFDQEITLVASIIFLLLYITGNGVIHVNKNKLERDTLIEYIILSIIALIILINAITK